MPKPLTAFSVPDKLAPLTKAQILAFLNFASSAPIRVKVGSSTRTFEDLETFVTPNGCDFTPHLRFCDNDDNEDEVVTEKDFVSALSQVCSDNELVMIDCNGGPNHHVIHVHVDDSTGVATLVLQPVSAAPKSTKTGKSPKKPAKKPVPKKAMNTFMFNAGNIEVDFDEFAEQFTQPTALQLIVALDIKQADTTFTEEVIRTLVTSLRKSLPEGECLDVESLFSTPKGFQP